MPGEDHWVAVAPQFSDHPAHEIRKAQSAYQFFQRDMTEKVKEDLIRLHGKFDIALFGKAVRDRWNALSDLDRRNYEELARQDMARFAQESHEADVAAMHRREKLQQERETLLLDMEGGDKRLTRRVLEKKQRKISKKEKRRKENGKEDFEEPDESDDWDSDELESDETNERPKKKTTSRTQISQKQIEYRDKIKKEKQEKDSYIANRQEDLRKERAAQAKRRLEFLLKQGGDIFSHFGNVKQETAKFGIKTQERKEGESLTRRNQMGDEEGDEALEEADEHEATYLTSQPSTLGFGKMRDYQLEGLNWMIRLQENGVNGILADEMGLGKTMQSIAILVYMLEYQYVNGPHLIVVPKSTLSNWVNEMARWAPTLTAVKFHGDKATREEIVKNVLAPAQRDEDRDWNIVITTYEVCNIERNTLSKFAWNYLIIDEAHRLKNEASAFSKTVRLFETKHRILLTGTPLQNSLHELWALLNFLVPDVFESSEQFDEWFNLDIEDNDEKNKLISQLHKILRPFMLRRLKADVEKDLPPKHETILFTGMSSMQKKLYRDILVRDIDAIQGNSGSRTAILNIVMQLRKCAGHPYLFPGVEDRSLPPLGEHLVENCGKMAVLDKLLRRLKDRGHRVLLFTQMTRILDIMEDYLVMRRFLYCRIDGNTSYEDREAYIDAFNAPESDKFIFLLSTRAGGLGINLQTADVVVLYDSDWNPQADLQAQDRAHRIGQKRPVQVFRLVTEHTIEEKIVERAQQKLKLDAMVVQQGRLKDKDKLSREELLAAVRFGADKIFKSKDSSITDDDIDFILDQGQKKTMELNEKLKAAEKGDLLDFKLDGSSVQTFEGVDYSRNALAEARAQAEMLGLFDIGKRERKEANYNENTLYQQQIAALQGNKKSKKKKEIRLPKDFRLPRMEEWQMYDRERLLKIQEEEEASFKALPEEIQKKAILFSKGIPLESEKTDETYGLNDNGPSDNLETDIERRDDEPFLMPQLISEETKEEKEKLLAEGFHEWKRYDFQVFQRASARYGRGAIDKIALEIGKPEQKVKEFAEAFWGDLGKSRISEHEYDRVVKFIERGERKIAEIIGLERGTRVLVSLFDNPWEELEFTHINCKDKLFTTEEDRHLLCWSRKYGYGQWLAIKMAIRRSPNFRFNYFLRSLPVDQLGKRCEQLMRAAEKEVEQLERHNREMAGLAVEPIEGDVLPSVELPKFRVIQKRMREANKESRESERRQLHGKVDEIEEQIRALQDRLKALNSGLRVSSPLPNEDPPSKKLHRNQTASDHTKARSADLGIPSMTCSESQEGTIGPEGTFLEYPEYDGREPPVAWKKPFTHFCVHTRKEVKSSLEASERKDKQVINKILKERWLSLSEDKKDRWRKWADWDKKRYERDLIIFNSRDAGQHEDDTLYKEDGTEKLHIPKKRKNAESSVPKKKRK